MVNFSEDNQYNIEFVCKDRRTAEYSSDIAEAVINETIQDAIKE